jgi:hypothetical protein
MSVEFKCDRCGKQIPPGDVSRKSGDFTIWRDNEESTFDLCKDCLDKLDIFMTGEMPAPEYKLELTYIKLPDPTVFTLEKSGSGYELHISADLDKLEKMLANDGFPAQMFVEDVILGVSFK